VFNDSDRARAAIDGLRQIGYTASVCPGREHLTVTEQTEAHDGRGWGWVALVAAIVVWIAGVPTLGLSVVVAPLTLLLSLVAWRRSPRDVVFWIGLALNGLLMLALVGEVVAVLTGEASIGWD
jgi:hypothetical protein